MNSTLDDTLPEREPNWHALEQATMRAFEAAGASDSPGMINALRRAIRYARVDRSSRQIVVDARAFLLGLLSSGQLDKPSQRFGNTASWLYAWIAERYPPVATSVASLTGTDELFEASMAEFRVVPSASMANAAQRAIGIARSTVRRDDADLRHLLAALVTNSRTTIDLLRHIGWRVSASDASTLRQHLFDRIAANPEKTEDMAAWEAILVDQSTQPPPPPRGEELSGFASDRPGHPAGPDGDPLDLADDVLAFARLICLDEVDPPLSIGLFGGWGSGKSTFMHRLENQVTELTAEARARHARQGPTATGASAPSFIRNAVQIRFNAWHFADANLWASLTAEFFDQFRAGGHARSGESIHARLVERVNNLVHSLSAEAKAAREALSESEKIVRAAQQARDKAAVGSALQQTLVDAAVAAYTAHRKDLDELGGNNQRKDIGTFIDLASSVQTVGGQARMLWRFITGRGWRLSLAVLGFALVAGTALGIANTDLLSRFAILNVLGLVAGLAAMGRSILPGVKLVAELVKSTATFAENLDANLEKQLKEVAAKEQELNQRTSETAALRAAADRTSLALARYVDAENPSNPPRLLRFMLEDNPDTQALEKEIGLISRVRRLFHALNEIVGEERKLPEADRSADVPDRIIIYIDDLDRCTPSQVYAVLQAIHLLLAFDLFVVVVGVDMHWVEEALAHELRPSLRGIPLTPEQSAAAELDARKLAARYLEKIFQLPFWLRRLSPEGHNGGSYGSYVRSMLRANLTAEGDLGLAPEPEPSGDVTFHATDPDLDRRVDFNASASDGAGDPETGGLDAALATVRLTAEEVEFLASEAIGLLAGREPRTVKRLINIYRIIRARFGASGSTRFLGDANTPAAFPLVAMLIAVETGQPIEIASSLHALLVPDDTGPLLTTALSGRLQQAFAAIEDQRNGVAVTRSELREWSAVTSRYSFHRYD